MNIDKNVLFIVRTMGLGGTENVVLQLCEILTGHVNKIVVCSSGGVHEKALENMGIKHYKIPDVSSKNPIDMLKIYKELKQIVQLENITIIHSHHRMAAFYTQLLQRRGVIKVATAHNTFTDKKILTKFSYKNTNLIAVGEMVKKNLVDYFTIPERQVKVIHNAIKQFNGDFKKIDLLEKERLNGNILIGNIGRLSEQKGMIYFIEAAKLTLQTHKNVKFFIVGDGELRESLHELVIKQGLEKNVIFLGYRSDIQNVMSQFDFIVLSSLWEGLPLTPIEAFSVGKTVIGTAVDGTPEIIEDGVNGLLVEPRNPLELSRKINLLIENSKLLKKLEENSLNTYNSKFSFKILSERYIDYYKKVRTL